MYTLPLPDTLPDDFRHSAKTCTSDLRDASQNVIFNQCPSPRHSRFSSAASHSSFVLAAEEQFEWVERIAGVKVAEGEKGRVPILWRGCARGCLGFLEHPQSEKQGSNSEDGFGAVDLCA